MRICVDPGHYKDYNRSPVIPDFYEGNRMWLLGELLRAALIKRGVEVVMTKQTIKENPSLPARGSMAKDCDAFISLHANTPAKRPDGTYDESKAGIVIFYPVKNPEVRPLAQQIAEKDAEIMRTVVFDVTTVHATYSADVDYYGVIRAAVAAGCKTALIVEHGFYTNPENCAMLMDDAVLQRIAEAEAEILVNWIDPQKKTYYRVQVGAYSMKPNANNKKAKLEFMGFSAFIELEEDKLYHVYSGSYEIRTNALLQKAKLKAAGFDSIIVEKTI